MATQRTDIGLISCLDEVQCNDTITAVGWNKIVQSIEGLYTIGTHLIDLPDKRVNRYRHPAIGWAFGSVALASAPATYQDSIVRHPIHINPHYDRWSLEFEVNLIDQTLYSGVGPSGIRFRFTKITILAYGYGNNTQLLAEIIPSGTPGTGQHVAAPNVVKVFNLTGQFNANMLPPSGEEFAGRITVEITTQTSIPPAFQFYWNKGSHTITGNADWFGLLCMKGRIYKVC